MRDGQTDHLNIKREVIKIEKLIRYYENTDLRACRAVVGFSEGFLPTVDA